MKALTKFLVVWILISIPLLVAGWFIGGILGLEVHLLILVSVIMTFLFMFIYLSSDKVLLHRYHARSLEVDSDGILKIARELSVSFDIPMPKVYTSDVPMPNLMVVGRSEKSASIVMTGKIDELLEKDELQAAFAYEMSRMKNGDTLSNTVVAMVCGSITALATIAMWASIFTGFGQEDDPGPMLVKFFVMGLVAPPVALIIQLTSKESSVFKADVLAFSMLSDPRKLISAIEKLHTELISNEYHANPSYVHLFMVSPLRVNFKKLIGLDLPTYNLLFRTHPSVQKRVRRLKYSGGK
ncbi:MAG: M48 family metalloprotease [Halobacteriota archaeon]|nr:M48 family metalloprotease [Halobacteriota archaeon]